MEKRKRIVIALVALHTALLACYTFPSALVPEKLRVLGQLWARPLFHQQWLLFAPDPPICSCELQWSSGSGSWYSIDYGPDTYLQRRSLQSMARNVQAEVHVGDTIPASELVRSMRGEVYHGTFDPGRGRELPTLKFRLMEQCVTDPKRPKERVERITNLHTP